VLREQKPDAAPEGLYFHEGVQAFIAGKEISPLPDPAH
jgi:hypothetical protein